MEPNPTEVSPWYLRNINQALALDELTGEVYMRTGITGDVIINGPVTIPGTVTVDSTPENPVHVHLDEVGTSGILTTPNLPISIQDAAGHANSNTYPVYVSGTVGVSGSVNIGTMPEVEIKNDSGNPISVSGTVTANQGTSPWVVSGTVTGSVTANMTQQNPAYLSVFEEPIGITITPVIQADSIYGLDPDFWNTTQLNGGTVTSTANSTWQVSSGTTPGGYARLATSRYMTYLPGQGSMFRWTAAFTTTGGTTKDAYGIDNIVQTTGPIDREDGYAIGYSGSTSNNASRKIGFLHRRGGKAEIRQLTVTVAPTGAQTATITLNGIAFTVSLTSSASTQYTAAEIAAKLKADPVASQQWDIDACGSIVTFIYYSPGLKNGAYSFSSTGAGIIAVAAFSQLVAGANPTDVWTYVDNWDNQDIAFDPTKLNVFGLDLRWLGAGIVRLFMEDPATGNMVLCHTQIWSSTNTVPHIYKPSLRLTYRSGTTNVAVTPSQDVVVSGASIFGGIQGIVKQTGSSQSYFNIDSTGRAKDTVWHLLSIQNPIIRNDGVNKSSLVIQELSVSAQGNDPSVVYIVKNSVGTSDYLVFNPLPNANNFLFAQYSISAVSENLALDGIALVQTLGINGNSQFNLAEYNLTLAPGETISVFISSSNALSRTSTGIAWRVD